MEKPYSSAVLSYEEARLIQRLRLIIARAANQDGLRWWDDQSLTDHAGYLLERTFAVSPSLAARRLAMAAAEARHTEAFKDGLLGLHLYHLTPDNEDGLAMRGVDLEDIEVPSEPITTIDSLKQHLLAAIGSLRPYTVISREGDRLRVKVPAASDDNSLVIHRAATLACAYLEGSPGNPVFPYCLE